MPFFPDFKKTLPSDAGFCLPESGRPTPPGPGGYRAEVERDQPERCRTERADGPGEIFHFSLL